MNKAIGFIGMVMSGLVFSLEIYGLRVLQAMEKMYGEWYTSALKYANEPCCFIALTITVICFALSLVFFFKPEKKS